jgi:hypothetical protein
LQANQVLFKPLCAQQNTWNLLWIFHYHFHKKSGVYALAPKIIVIINGLSMCKINKQIRLFPVVSTSFTPLTVTLKQCAIHHGNSDEQSGQLYFPYLNGCLKSVILAILSFAFLLLVTS